MKIQRAAVFGVLGALAISAVAAAARGVGVPVRIELYLGTMFGLVGTAAFAVGLIMHVVIGVLFALLYAELFERVWLHGGAGMGMILSFLHASIIGMLLGMTAMLHPHVPELLPEPGAYFSKTGGTAGVVVFYALHLVYGAIVGGGYGHVLSEREWAPAGRM